MRKLGIEQKRLGIVLAWYYGLKYSVPPHNKLHFGTTLYMDMCECVPVCVSRQSGHLEAKWKQLKDQTLAIFFTRLTGHVEISEVKSASRS